MPFYEYECSSCGKQTEILQKISEAPARKCPHCGKSALKRLISAPVFRLKGGGWYETDFKTDQDRKRNLVGSDDSGSSEAKPDAPKTEGKDAAKPADAKSTESKPAEKPAEKPASTVARSDSKKSSAKSASKAPVKTPIKTKPAAKKKARR